MTRSDKDVWPDERRQRVRDLWAEGRSASEIARTLGDGATRSAIIGIAHRMHLPPRPSPIAKRSTAVAKSTTRLPQRRPHLTLVPPSPTRQRTFDAQKRKAEDDPALRLMPPLEIDAPFASAMPPHQEPRGCLFPHGFGRDWRFCQKPTIADGRPYCADHHAVCYRPTEIRR